MLRNSRSTVCTFSFSLHNIMLKFKLDRKEGGVCVGWGGHTDPSKGNTSHLISLLKIKQTSLNSLMTGMRLLNYTLCFKMLSEPRGLESWRSKRPDRLNFQKKKKRKIWKTAWTWISNEVFTPKTTSQHIFRCPFICRDEQKSAFMFNITSVNYRKSYGFCFVTAALVSLSQLPQ